MYFLSTPHVLLVRKPRAFHGGALGKYRNAAEKARNAGLDWVLMQFTDLLGYFRQVALSTKYLLNNSSLPKLDGSSVKGFTGVEESDLVLEPVLESFATIPWLSRTGRFICRVFYEDKRFTRDPRYVAEKLDDYLENLGYKPLLSAELEYFLFNSIRVEVESFKQVLEFTSFESNISGSSMFNRPKEGYYVTYPKDLFEDFKLQLAEVLEKNFDIQVEAFHHEVAACSQHEVNFKGGSATYLGDAVQTTKYVVKALAYKKGCIATFMPKPIHGDNGSGMHIHVSLWKNSRNAFYDPSDKYLLSQEARYFIGGLIEHGRALSALVSPTVNSYKRLVPGYEAPVYLVWARANRSAAIRIPGYATREASVRVEYRPPDPSANPYLAVAAVVLAGLDGIKKKIDPGDPVEENVYEMPASKRRELRIKELPRTLDEALDELECDNEWLKPVFTSDLLEVYIELKRDEARKVSSYPSPAEAYYYLDI